MSERLRGASLPAGVKPQQHDARLITWPLYALFLLVHQDNIQWGHLEEKTLEERNYTITITITITVAVVLSELTINNTSLI